MYTLQDNTSGGPRWCDLFVYRKALVVSEVPCTFDKMATKDEDFPRPVYALEVITTPCRCIISVLCGERVAYDFSLSIFFARGQFVYACGVDLLLKRCGELGPSEMMSDNLLCRYQVVLRYLL